MQREGPASVGVAVFDMSGAVVVEAEVYHRRFIDGKVAVSFKERGRAGGAGWRGCKQGL